MNFPIYFDNNATTQLDPEVLLAMMPYLTQKYGNASSGTHVFGREASQAIEIAREQIARLIRCKSDEIVFTGSTTESINLALKGIIESSDVQKPHIISSMIEHKAVLNVLKYLQRYGVEVTLLQPDEYGIINPDDIKKSIRKNTLIVSIMAANNEIGSLQPIGDISMICKENGILFHTDAAQVVGKIPLDLESIKIDLMSFGAHKFYGPKGVGALYINAESKITITPQINGGGQEKGLRSGTYDTAAIVGFGKAASICEEKFYDEFTQQTIWRDRIIANILMHRPGSKLNGHPKKRLPNNINISFNDITNSMFTAMYKDFAVSFGSACSSETLEPSYVLSNIRKTKNEINSSIRIGLGRFNTEEEIDYFIERIKLK